MRGHKTSLSKLKKIEILSGIFFYHNTMRLAIHYKKKKTAKNTAIQNLGDSAKAVPRGNLYKSTSENKKNLK